MSPTTTRRILLWDEMTPAERSEAVADYDAERLSVRDCELSLWERVAIHPCVYEWRRTPICPSDLARYKFMRR